MSDSSAPVRCARRRGRARRAAARPVPDRDSARPVAVADPAADQGGPASPRPPAARCARARRCAPGSASSSTFPSCARPTPQPEALPLRIVFEDPDVVVLDKPAGMVVHPGRRARERHARQRAAASRQGSERHRRRGAPGHRPPARSRHLGADGRRQARPGAPGAGAAVSGPRGREGIRRARLGRRAGRAPHRCADRPRSEGPAEDVDPRAAGAQRGHAGHLRAALQGRRRSSRWRSPPGARIRSACISARSAIRSSATRPTAACTAGSANNLRAVMRLERPFLHACRLAFTHPGDGRRVEFDSPLPPELEAVIEDIARREKRVVTRAESMPTGTSFDRAHLRRQGLRRRSRPRAHAERPRGDGRRHPPSAVGGDRPVPEPGHVILIRQYRYAVNRWLWELPAGSVDEGETPEQAARRECHEEIGQVPDTVVRLGAMFPTPGYCDEEMFFFRVSGLERAGARGGAGRRRRHRGPGLHAEGRAGHGAPRRDRRHEDGDRAEPDLIGYGSEARLDEPEPLSTPCSRSIRPGRSTAPLPESPRPAADRCASAPRLASARAAGPLRCARRSGSSARCAAPRSDPP